MGFLRFPALCLHLTVDGDVRILIESGIRFESRFGLGSAFADREKMVEEPNPPFECFDGMVPFECVCLSLGFFDEFAVSDAGCGPVFWEMVGIEFEKSVSET